MRHQVRAPELFGRGDVGRGDRIAQTAMFLDMGADIGNPLAKDGSDDTHMGQKGLPQAAENRIARDLADRQMKRKIGRRVGAIVAVGGRRNKIRQSRIEPFEKLGLPRYGVDCLGQCEQFDLQAGEIDLAQSCLVENRDAAAAEGRLFQNTLGDENTKRLTHRIAAGAEGAFEKRFGDPVARGKFACGDAINDALDDMRDAVARRGGPRRVNRTKS